MKRRQALSEAHVPTNPLLPKLTLILVKFIGYSNKKNIEKLRREKMKKQWIAIGIVSVLIGTVYTVQVAKAKRNKPL
jgi:hypothetical protein